MPGMSTSYSELAFDPVHELVRRDVDDIPTREGRSAFHKPLAGIAKPIVLELVALPKRRDPGGQHVIDGAKTAGFDLRGGEPRGFVGDD